MTLRVIAENKNASSATLLYKVTAFGFVNSISFSPNSLLLGVLNALKNGRLDAGWSGRVPGWLVSHFFSFVSHFFSLSPRLGARSRVSGRLVSHFLAFVSQFFLKMCPPFVSLLVSAHFH